MGILIHGHRYLRRADLGSHDCAADLDTLLWHQAIDPIVFFAVPMILLLLSFAASHFQRAPSLKDKSQCGFA